VSAETAPRRRYHRHWVYIPPTRAAIVVTLLLLARLEWQPFQHSQRLDGADARVGDYAFVQHFHFTEPRRDDVVVFEMLDTYFVKRIVGTPGDRRRLAAGAI
jgi:hypothetical protein